MAIHINCGICKHELEEPGALYFSVPDVVGDVRKIHICVACSVLVTTLLADVKDAMPEKAAAG